MTFRVEQKVVCIKRDSWKAGYGDEINPEYGSIYTVRGIVDYPGDDPGLLLCEIVNDPRDYSEGYRECDFKAFHFRPVIERKVDISIFTKMLRPQGVDA